MVLRTVRIVVRLAASTSTKAALEEAQDGVASWGELCRLLADERPEGRLGGRCCCFLCHGVVLDAVGQPQREGLCIFAPCSAGAGAGTRARDDMAGAISASISSSMSELTTSGWSSTLAQIAIISVKSEGLQPSGRPCATIVPCKAAGIASRLQK